MIQEYDSFSQSLIISAKMMQNGVLFGAAWQSSVELNVYQTKLTRERVQQHSKNPHLDFQVALYNQFDVTFSEDLKDVHKCFHLDCSNLKDQKIEVYLFIYNYRSMKGKLINKSPSFHYKVSSIYKIPLSERQVTSFVFHRLFNILQAENLFISIELCPISKRLIIQLSKHESDVLNLIFGEVRLAKNYWKPILVDKIEVESEGQLSFFHFIKKTIQQLPNSHEKNHCKSQFLHENKFSTKMFTLLRNPFNFFNLSDIEDQKVDLSDYFSQKEKITFRRDYQSQTCQIQYTQQCRGSSNDSFSVIIYFYDQRQITKNFKSSKLLISFQKIAVLKKPLSQKQYTNAFFKQNILVLFCKGFFLSLQINSYYKELTIQISKEQQKILKLFRGQNRFSSNYWSLQQQQSLLFSQERINSLENIISIVAECMDQSSLLGSWKASNNVIQRIFDKLVDS